MPRRAGEAIVADVLRLRLAGIDTLVTTPACATCHHSPAGCCAAPPRVALADLARIVLHGERDFLLEELAAGRLLAGPANGWLVLPRRPHASGVLACGYLGERGCVLPPERRSSTCNIYVCDEALARDEDPATATRTRDARDALEGELSGLDAMLAECLADRYPKGYRLDAEVLDFLAVTLRALRGESLDLLAGTLRAGERESERVGGAGEGRNPER